MIETLKGQLQKGMSVSNVKGEMWEEANNTLSEIQVYITLDIEELKKLGFREAPTKEEVTNRLHEFLSEIN